MPIVPEKESQPQQPMANYRFSNTELESLKAMAELGIDRLVYAKDKATFLKLVNTINQILAARNSRG